jgi:hypothetical protein
MTCQWPCNKHWAIAAVFDSVLMYPLCLSAQHKVVDDADSSDYEVSKEEDEEPDDDADLSDEGAPAAKPGKRAQRTRKPSARKVTVGLPSV